MDPATNHAPVVGYHHLLHIGDQYAPYSIRRGIVPVAQGQRELFEGREAP